MTAEHDSPSGPALAGSPGRGAAPVFVADTATIEEGFARRVLHGGGAGEPPREFVLCRFRGELYALDSLCPHEGGRLAEGPLMEDRYPVCPLHLYKFDPATGAAVGVECEPALTYPVREEDGEAHVWAGGGAPPA